MWKYLLVSIGSIIVFCLVLMFWRAKKKRYELYLDAGLIRPPERLVKRVYEHVILFAEVDKNNICQTERRYDFSRYEEQGIVGFQLLWNPMLDLNEKEDFVRGVVVDAELVELIDGRIIWIRKKK